MNQRMKLKILPLLFLAMLPFSAYSTTLAPHSPFKIYSPNRKFFVQMIPSREGYGPAEYQGKAFAVGSSQVLWKIEGYRDFFLCDDGIHFVQLGSPYSADDQFSGLAIEFYKNGQKLKSYAIKELLKDPKALKKSESVYHWRAFSPPQSKLGQPGFSPDGTRYTLYLNDGSAYVFDVTNGSIVQKQ